MRLNITSALPIFLGGPVLLIFSTLIKGQFRDVILVSFHFFPKRNKNKWTISKNEFVCSFFGRNFGLKKPFQIFLTFIGVAYIFHFFG